MIVKFEIDTETLDAFDIYCITIAQSRNAVMSSLIADYINGGKINDQK